MLLIPSVYCSMVPGWEFSCERISEKSIVVQFFFYFGYIGASKNPRERGVEFFCSRSRTAWWRVLRWLIYTQDSRGGSLTKKMTRKCLIKKCHKLCKSRKCSIKNMPQCCTRLIFVGGKNSTTVLRGYTAFGTTCMCLTSIVKTLQ